MPQTKAQTDAFNLFRRLGINPTRQHLLEVMDGASYDAFLLLDEKPGLFDGNYTQHAWHRVMRIERNDPSSPLLDGLRRSGTGMRSDVLDCGCPRQIVIDEGHQEGCDLYSLDDDDIRAVAHSLGLALDDDFPGLDDTDTINETLRDIGSGSEL